ncbi:50S ribosomal protein L4 [Caldinitratiruptor microaerophilus]|uniref:Large ribosomal subunit protein uL4 n=1 Tax=Caldinitratiruptor microaerophilus TaxID=671077 RepID=A0AA35G734_9FIRM|nr:50S ribosomal protein L4 [Caldinitratiruptor microaerophilus]BDG62221.1 50S ribosomal protein L4 [Caldinitratiruptor microaerophilus]
MPTVPVYNKDGQQVGELTLRDDIFGLEPNPHVLHQVVTAYLANQRQGTHDTKTRAEVSGGGRKPWRQKGTGRARQGSIRAPHWRHGGIVFGPHPRSYRIDVPGKLRRLALKQALSDKVQGGNFVVLDEYKLEKPRTKAVVQLLKNFGADRALIVTADGDITVYKSARNIPGVGAMRARDLNTYQVLRAPKVIITKDAVAVVEEVLG